MIAIFKNQVSPSIIEGMKKNKKKKVKQQKKNQKPLYANDNVARMMVRIAADVLWL